MGLIACAAAVLIVFCIAVSKQRSANSLPRHDQGEQLSLAISMHRSGGAWGLLGRCLRGTYREANRHPLLPLILSPWATPAAGFFSRACTIGLVVFLLGFSVYLLLLYKMEGWRITVITGLLFLLFPDTARFATQVAPEALLAVTCAVGWLLLRGGHDRHKLAAGAAFGFAYLLKASIVPFFIAALIALYICDLRRRRSMTLIIAGFVAVCWPLLWRNLLVYENPFYNLNQHVFWLDSWWQYWPHTWLGSLQQVGMNSYLSNHTFGDIMMRFFSGVWSVFLLLLGRWPFAGIVGGIVFFPVLALGLRTATQRTQRMAFSIAGGFYLVLFSWYAAIDLSSRFFYPLLLIIAYYGARGLLVLWDNYSTRKQFLWVPLALASSILIVGVTSRVDIKNPDFTVHHAEVGEAINWMNANIKPHSRVVMDTDDFFTWMLKVPIFKACLPISEKHFVEFIARGKADIVIRFDKHQAPAPVGYQRRFANSVVSIFFRQT